MGKRILIQGWKTIKAGDTYYSPYYDWVYLNEIAKYFDHICLLSVVKPVTELEHEDHYSLNQIGNISVKELPYFHNYVSAVKHFLKYISVYKELSGRYDVCYVRYPAPFGWLSKFYFKNKKWIIHFVGAPEDVTRKNPNMGIIEKYLKLIFFKPEFLAFKWACKGADVYTNGFHIAKKLKAQGIEAEPLISSTLQHEEFHFDLKNGIHKAPKFLYVGFLRTAKGVEVIVRAFKKLLNDFPKATLTLVGDGGFRQKLEEIVKEEQLTEKITFAGYINNRKKLNEYYRSHDVFLFASFSEGSPRTVLEAMANSLPVISTPVGSLPIVFEDGKEIIFADFNNPESFYRETRDLLLDKHKVLKIRKNAFKRAKNLTVEQFLGKIFLNNYET